MTDKVELRQTFEEVCYSLPEIDLHGISKGDDNQPIVLCLHGWLDNAASFIPLMNELNNYQIIAIDWPGHGHSDHRGQDAHYHFIDYVYDLLLLFEFNQWDSIDIVAHSMGGMIASAFAAAFPEKVNSLTLIDSIGFISAKSEETTEQLRNGMLSRLKLKGKRKPIHPNLESAITARRSVSDLTYDDAKLIVERGSLTLEAGITWRADSRLRNTSPYRLTFSQAKQFIKDITTLVQLIYGDKGIEFVELGLTHYGPLFKQFTAHKLHGGHHIHMEQAKKTASIIESFLEKQGDI
ncbi:MAG: alpha/beta hydrolase [Thalassotalea sp.]|nr:alpha/beta hydrolase [Thalassotalea sp.]